MFMIIKNWLILHKKEVCFLLAWTLFIIGAGAVEKSTTLGFSLLGAAFIFLIV